MRVYNMQPTIATSMFALPTLKSLIFQHTYFFMEKAFKKQRRLQRFYGTRFFVLYEIEVVVIFTIIYCLVYTYFLFLCVQFSFDGQLECCLIMYQSSKLFISYNLSIFTDYFFLFLQSIFTFGLRINPGLSLMYANVHIQVFTFKGSNANGQSCVQTKDDRIHHAS